MGSDSGGNQSLQNDAKEGRAAMERAMRQFPVGNTALLEKSHDQLRLKFCKSHGAEMAVMKQSA